MPIVNILPYLGGTVICATGLVYFLFIDNEHEHNERPDLYVTKSKPFPWKCHDCGLFEQACWDECLGREGKAHGH